MNTAEIDDLVFKIDRMGTDFTPHEIDLLVDALEFYKEMNIL